MVRLLEKIESHLDDFNVKKKLYILYICCVLLPLVLTDSIVIHIVLQSEKSSIAHEMENVSNAVKYNFSSDIENVADLAKSIYMNKYIYEFLEKEYESELDYVKSYQSFFKDTLFESGVGVNNYQITMYSDNDTIINGGNFGRMETVYETDWYQTFLASKRDKLLYFSYDENQKPIGDAERKILFIQKLDFYKNYTRPKILKIELDYSTYVRNLISMNYQMPVYLYSNDKIYLSNAYGISVKKDYDAFTDEKKAGYVQKLELYGLDLNIYVEKPHIQLLQTLRRNLPVLLLLLTINIILPFMLVQLLNHSFTKRISELSEAFKQVEDEKLTEIDNVRGKDEIGLLMENYNKMVVRTNTLIQIVYKNRLREQEMMVARKNAELLALHSQINPHFLFNALDSIRMHSLLKKELETADMVEKLAVMQRQYVDWGEDLVAVEKEMEFVKAYLSLQKYRFGDRLSYELNVSEECKQMKLPKLTVVTFVENACIHGIEGKKTPGWIFVRIYRREQNFCLEIEDTGNGMCEEEMEKLQEKMEHADITMLQEKQRVGVINACLRLKMLFCDEVHFKLDGEKGIGLMVQIQIPIQ